MRYPVQWFAKGKHRRLLGGTWNTPDAGGETLARLNAANFDTYYHINTSSHVYPKLKGSTSDIITVRSVLIDIDPERPAWLVPRTEWKAIRHWISKTLCIPEEAMSAVWSGRGLQYLIHLTPVPPPPMIVNRTHTMLKQLSANAPFAYKIDTSTSDLARVARMPGSRNSRTGFIASLLDEGTKEIPWEDLLMRYHLVLSPPRQEREPPASITRAWLLKELNVTAAEFVFEGVSYPNRHRAAYATAKCLQELGIGEEDAQIIVREAATKCCPVLSEYDASRQVRCAYNS